jgi:S-adenosylmethionine hydrolase
MIVLFTDFGWNGPYVGQLKAVLCRQAPAGAPVVDLMHDAPAFDPRASAYLLAALAEELPRSAVVLGVVDPGVGGPRRAVVVEADGRWYVGPDNGLFEVVARRAFKVRWWEVTWRPERLSASFHGRDLFAPLAARIARGEPPPGRLQDPPPRSEGDWPDDLAQVIYVDGYGNALTGLRAYTVAPDAVLVAGGRRLYRSRTFCDVPVGEAFWYQGSIGLAELAVNQGSAADLLGLGVGTPVRVADG